MITDANAATSTAPLGSAGRERACSGAAAVPPANQPGGEVLRILLVEDSAFDLEIIRDILRGLGRELRLAAVATRAGFEAELKRELPQLILSDYSLPGFDGITVLQIAQELAPEIPFVFVTGTLGEEVAIEMLKLGATDYVLKNRLSRLVPAVSRALREAEQRHDRKLAEEKLRRSHDQLRALAGRLQVVREEERTRIAREVHDELGQALTGLKLDLAWLSGRLRSSRGLHGKIKIMSGQIDATIQSVRRIATELRPGVLDSLGLAAAIEWQGADFEARTGIRCAVTVEAPETIPDPAFGTAYFRIFQETLTNIIRHAQATSVEVRLAQVGQQLALTIRDNGRGITEREIAHAHSLGLIGMKERAAQVGGEVCFVGVPGRSTTVILRAPLPAAPGNPGHL
jgi:signal transduction histidine kinase